jgi:non-homologous end joining protein Ku
MTVTALAASPQRSTTSFHIGWGLIDIHVSAYTGTEETRVARKEFIKDGKNLVSVGRAAIRKDTGEVIDSGDVIRMAQASSGEWVALSDDEIAECTSPRGQAEIVAFVPIKDAGQYLAENQMQVRPQAVKGKVAPATEKAFTLLMAAMKKRKVVALVKIAMRGPARFALIDAEGTMTLVRTADAVRTARPLPEVAVAKGELDMALMLIDTVGVDAPVLTDDTAPVVSKFVEAKATGKPVEVKAAPSIAAGDLMAQLEASIAAKKKAKAS